MDDRLKNIMGFLKLISKIGNKLSNIECEASVYTLDDDEFGNIMFMRDLSDLAIKELILIDREISKK